jgi:Domain of unknown function (DUF4829)
MKKIIIWFCCILSLFSLVGCNQGEVSNDIVINVSESTKFSKDEINNAIEIVKDNFSFPASTLTKIWYDEEKSNKLVDEYLETGLGSVNEVNAENVIILLSNFDVDDSGDNLVLNRNTTYKDYQWILIRDNKTSDWKIDSWGF